MKLLVCYEFMLSLENIGHKINESLSKDVVSLFMSYLRIFIFVDWICILYADYYMRNYTYYLNFMYIF
jgi:hypothetical protein